MLHVQLLDTGGCIGRYITEMVDLQAKEKG